MQVHISQSDLVYKERVGLFAIFSINQFHVISYAGSATTSVVRLHIGSHSKNHFSVASNLTRLLLFL